VALSASNREEFHRKPTQDIKASAPGLIDPELWAWLDWHVRCREDGQAMQQAFEAFAEWYAVYGYPILFLGVLLENAGVPVPGETAVLVAGFLASPAGGERFSLGWVIALTFGAAVLGDNFGFWLGRRLARPRLQRGRAFLVLTPQALRKTEGFFARYGILTVFVARFITGLRVVAALAAGTAGMPWSHFFFANAGGALVWATTISFLGYFFGRSWQLLDHWLGWGTWIILGCAILVLVLRRLWVARTSERGQ
jgi:membrane-associated protein